MERGPFPGPGAATTEADGAVPAHDHPAPFARRPRRRCRAPRGHRAACWRRPPAGAAPGTAAEAARAGPQGRRRSSPSSTSRCTRPSSSSPTQQAAATAAAEQAAAAQAALAVYEPQLRAIAQSGYTGKTQSRVAAFLTSDSADELVQQMTTLDMIAAHTNAVIAEVAAAQAAAAQAQAAADAGRRDRAGRRWTSSRRSRPRSRSRSTDYQADLRPALGRRAGRRHHRRRRPRARGLRGRPAPGARHRRRPPPIEAALAQVGDRYAVGRRPARTASTAPA